MISASHSRCQQHAGAISLISLVTIRKYWVAPAENRYNGLYKREANGRRIGMIVLFTDFGLEGPYTGQIKAVLASQAPGVPVIDLFADAPGFDPKGAAHLLAAYAPE